MVSIANPQWRAQLVNLKRQHDDLTTKISALPKDAPHIDWDRYRKVSSAPTIIDELKAEYESSVIPPADAAGELKAIEDEYKQTSKEAEQYIAYVQDRLNKLSVELKTLETSKPIDDLTFQDVLNENPNLEKEAAAKRNAYEY